jgi:hypothetical protein
MIVDPPNGRLPPQTPEAQRPAAPDREFFLALVLSTDACKNKVSTNIWPQSPSLTQKSY